jgi:hypothetical protein
LKSIHKFATVGVSSLMVTVALTPGALAAGTARASVGVAAVRAATLPNSNIKGRPTHFSPSSLTATARWAGSSSCTASQGSFTITNTKSRTEKVKVVATGISESLRARIRPHHVYIVCLTTGYTGTVHAILKDKKKLTVTF